MGPITLDYSKDCFWTLLELVNAGYPDASQLHTRHGTLSLVIYLMEWLDIRISRYPVESMLSCHREGRGWWPADWHAET